ncbi:histidinol-phosphate transaminase [Firmicutes bacterium M10-2]|nr:histidinol-phosphate transaminase [Firmicutes bacterium M10-2]
MYYLNPNVEYLNRIFDQNSRKEYLRLDLNENPGGLSQEFIEKVLSKIDARVISEYPETLEFTEILAKYLGTDIEHICLVNGSSEGIRYIIEAFTSINGKILGVTPTYAMFEVYSKMYGREFIPVTYTDDLKMPVERILEKMTKEVQLLILVNPNNPMGNVYTEEEFKQILKKAKENEITILVDEAYHYFYSETFLQYALENEHVFLTRTFSKMFSLAGARLGYVVGWPAGVKMIQKLCTPHNVNAFAQLFAQSIIETPGMIEDLIKKHKDGREYLQKELEKYGYEYEGETGNFIFIKPKTNADILVQRMKNEKGILIKSYNGIGKFGTCLRVTTAEKQYMKRFLTALFELDN